MKLNGIEYIEFYVGNAPQAAHFYRTALGFTPVAFAALETGERNKISLLIQQNEIRFILTSPLQPESPIAEHVNLHGDSVKDIAFSVDDAGQAFHEAVKHGAKPVMEPDLFESDGQQIIKATVATCGDTVHSFIQRSVPDHIFLPGYQPIKNVQTAKSIDLAVIDHIAICVNPGEVDHWISFYMDVFDFQLSHQEDIVTEYSAMNSKVVQDSTGRIKFPIMEPAPGRGKSQIEEYLTYHRGPGAQHIALLSSDIMNTVRTLHENGINFLSTPDSYYDVLADRVGQIEEDSEALRDLHVLVDRDQWGYLMQVFTKPLHGRPTAFFEIIQRKGARGFGSGNIKALFEAIEREQALRKNL